MVPAAVLYGGCDDEREFLVSLLASVSAVALFRRPRSASSATAVNTAPIYTVPESQRPPAESEGVWGCVSPLFENMGPVICPNLHRNSEDGRN